LPSSAGIVRLLAGRGHISEAKLNSYFPFYKGYLALDRLGRKDYRTVASISIGGDEVRVPLLIMNNNMIRLFTGVKVYPQLIHSLVDEGGEAILNQAADQLYEDRNSTTMVKLGLSDAANREYGTLYQPTRDFRQRMASYFRCAGKTGTHEDIAHDFIGTCATLFIEPEADARKIDPDITGIAVSVYLQSNRASIHAKELLQDILRILLNTYYPTLGPMLTPGPL
jgi:cell division protein FtsI/penicillin-binding protein 2